MKTVLGVPSRISRDDADLVFIGACIILANPHTREGSESALRLSLRLLRAARSSEALL